MNEQEYNQYIKAVKNYTTARYSILIAIILTAVNLVASFFNSYFFTSIYSSTLFFNLGLLWKKQAMNTAQAQLANGFLIIGIFIGLLILGIFALFYFLSKKKGWTMIVLTVLMAIDTVLIIFVSLGVIQIIPDLLFHGLMLFVLIRGIKSANALERDFDDGVMTTPADITEIYHLLNSKNQKNN